MGKSVLSTIVLNLSGVRIRQAMLEGRPHMVVPMIMLKEGVLNGNGGALLYPREELEKTPESWNHKPVVVYHPQINGQGVSACDPEILNGQKVGIVLNTRFDGSKLHAEAWLEENRVKAIDSRILDKLGAGQMVEISTGLFTDNQSASGEFRGKPYSAIARNYRPDHLAILPDKVGACSIADGAGLLRTNSEAHGEGGEQPLASVRFGWEEPVPDPNAPPPTTNWDEVFKARGKTDAQRVRGTLDDFRASAGESPLASPDWGFSK